MNPEDSKEYKILVTLRQVLASVVREITPEPGMRHPLTEKTVEDIRQCFALIAAREKELTDNAGMPSQHRPHFAGQPPKAKIVKLHGIDDRNKDE